MRGSLMQTLKLSKDTINVLKNFCTINPMIYFKAGSAITTISPGKTIFARYESPETFDSSFGIYKLDKLLSILSFFSDPELLISDKNLTIKEGKQKAKMAFANPIVLVYPEKDKVTMPSIDASFTLKEVDLNAITKAFAVMELPEVAFVSDGKKLSIKALDHKDPGGDSYTIEVSEDTGHDVSSEFTALFNINNLKMMPGDYNVKLTSKGIAEFSNDKLSYWLAIEKDSKF